MTELSLLLFFTSRSPTFGIKWNLTCLSSLRSVDHQAMFKRLGQSDEDDIEPVLYFDAKLFANPWFVFTHLDLNLENAFVSEDGSVQGLIKWDGVAAVPLSCGKREISFLAQSRLRSGDVRMGRRSGLLIAAENPLYERRASNQIPALFPGEFSVLKRTKPASFTSTKSLEYGPRTLLIAEFLIYLPQRFSDLLLDGIEYYMKKVMHKLAFLSTTRTQAVCTIPP
ncbi:conserved hypothetical protein [Coccidioides posadasii str. Silveira]|uniref:Aminoglycoside phosphotransferase domain-containing protein n=1 Tax=Coccidioides posadasii (strain RMSCC 757 / Silveira) TaxID=443226 RepID=E9DJC4_COCPS|nr:conserved hypothetical protein [Coccidioides posadasii str. Silveira]